jgi:general secretion pathway protein G
MKKNDEGFTLIELLIVIVILGILAAVVVFAVGGITQDAEQNACQAEKRAVETAVEAFRADRGNYPGDTASIVGTTDGFLRDTPEYWSVSGSTVSAAVTLPGTCA